MQQAPANPFATTKNKYFDSYAQSLPPAGQGLNTPNYLG